MGNAGQSQVEPVWRVRVNYNHIQSVTVPPGHTHFYSDLAGRYSIFGSVQMMTKCSKSFAATFIAFFPPSALWMVCCVRSQFKLKNKFRLIFTIYFFLPRDSTSKKPKF